MHLLTFYFSAQINLPGGNLDEKPGKCPPVSAEDSEKECPFTEVVNTTCLLDKDCPGQQKCCQLPCKTACFQPVDIPAVKILVGPKGQPGDKGDPVSTASALIIIYFKHLEAKLSSTSS